MLLAHVCALHDPTPQSFYAHIIDLHRRGVLDGSAIAYLVEMGVIQPSLLASSCAQNKDSISPTQSAPPPPPPILLSRYRREFEEIATIGRGNFGTVYLSSSRVDGRRYAIKKIVLHMDSDHTDVGELLRREVQCLARCDHPNVVRYYTAWMEPGWMNGDGPFPAGGGIGTLDNGHRALAEINNVFVEKVSSTTIGGENSGSRSEDDDSKLGMHYHHRRQTTKNDCAPEQSSYLGDPQLNRMLSNLNTTKEKSVTGTLHKDAKNGARDLFTGKSSWSSTANNERKEDGDHKNGLGIFHWEGDSADESDYIGNLDVGYNNKHDGDCSEWSEWSGDNTRSLKHHDSCSAFTFDEERPAEQRLRMWYERKGGSEAGTSRSDMEMDYTNEDNIFSGYGPIVPYDSCVGNLSTHKLPPHGPPATAATAAPPIQYSICLFIQMQLCRPTTLADWIRERNARLMPLAQTKNGDANAATDSLCSHPSELRAAEDVALQIVKGLVHIHSCGIVHRDLKPSNIFADGGDVHKPTFRIGDFGLSKLVYSNDGKKDGKGDIWHKEYYPIDDSGKDGSHSAVAAPSLLTQGERHTLGVGTASYASPEQISTTNYGPPSDIFSLGIILLEIFCILRSGHERAAAFYGCRHSNGRRRNLPENLEANLPKIATWIRRCTDADPAGRPSAHELLLELEQAGWGTDTPRSKIEDEGQLIPLSSNILSRSPGACPPTEIEDLRLMVEDQRKKMNEKDEIIRKLQKQLNELGTGCSDVDS